MVSYDLTRLILAEVRTPLLILDSSLFLLFYSVLKLSKPSRANIIVSIYFALSMDSLLYRKKFNNECCY